MPSYADKQKPEKFHYTYSRDHDNLTRLSPEEIAAERVKLRREMENMAREKYLDQNPV